MTTKFLLRYGSRVILLALNVLSLCGCSLILPHPMTGDSLDTGSCSLELDRSRQLAACENSAAGAPTPIIIRLAAHSAPDPAIYNRSLVKLTIDPPSAKTPDRSYDIWRIDLLRTPSPRPSPRRLADGDLIYLWSVTAHRYLRISPSQGAVADARHRSHAAIFALYKADVTDPNRPNTCDERLRDGDYVYIRALAPSTWLTVSESALQAAPPLLPPENVRASSIAADQICRTDERDQLLCAGNPHCPHP